MKMIGRIVLIGVGVVFSVNLLHAQTSTGGSSQVAAMTPSNLAAMVAVLAQTTPLPPESIPRNAALYSAQNPQWPPLPGNFNNLPAWSLGGNVYMLDDLDFDYQAAAQARAIMQPMDMSPPPIGSGGGGGGGGGSGGGGSPPPSYTTNDLWIQCQTLTNDSTGTTASLLIHAPQPSVFDLFFAPALPPPGSHGWYWIARALPGEINLTVPNLPTDSGFFILGTTNGEIDPTTGLTAACMGLVGPSALTNDFNGNGIPDIWEVSNFGGLRPGTNDYDGDGFSILAEWQAGVEPNKVLFGALFDNLRVSGNTATATFTVLQGVPAQVAVLVDNTNFALANWTAYSPTVPVSLGSTEGRHEAWLGLKGRAETSLANWQGYRLIRDTTAPLIFVSSPVSTTVSQPLLQLQGYSPEPLASLRYDVANDAGTLANLQGYITRQWFDTNLLEVTTNWFECLDIPLTNGVNTITLYATDQAGNVSTNAYNYTLDYSGVTNPPALTLYWPQDGAQVSGASFTLRGLVDDPTANVTALITDANGDASQVAGLVERSGLLWVENLPLGPGTNTLTLTMTNAAGLSSSTNLSVVESDVVLTIDDLSATDLNQPYIYVSGTISTNGYSVWVNGVQATLNGDGTWSAANVPVNDGGTAVIQARAIPNTDNGGSGTGGSGGTNSTMANPGNPSSPAARDSEAGPDKAPAVVMIHYDKELVDSLVRLGSSPEYSDTWTTSIIWNLGQPGSYLWDECWGTPAAEYFHWISSVWDTNGVGTQYAGAYGGSNICGIIQGGASTAYTLSPNWPSEFCCRSASRLEADDSGIAWTASRERTASTRYELHTGGKATSHGTSLFAFSASAQSIMNPFYPEVDDNAQNYDIAPANILLGGLGRLGSDGNLCLVLADNTTNDITPLVQGNSYYTFTQPEATKYRPRILANSQDCEPDFFSTAPVFVVGQYVTFSSAWQESPPYGGTPPGLQTNLTTNKWSLAGNFFNDGTNSVPGVSWPACSSNYFVNASMLTNDAATNNWWVSGGTISPAAYPVALDKGLTFSNGQYVSLHEEGRINMRKPIAKIITQTTSVNVIGSRLTFSCVVNGTEVPGITFTPSIRTGGFPGVAGWQQVNFNPVRIVRDGSQTDHSYVQPGPGPWLDLGDNPQPNTDQVPARNDGTTVDSPFLDDSLAVRVEASDTFTMWLMYQPNGGRKVPLRAVDWTWWGFATNALSVWTLGNGTNSVSPTDYPTETYPSWKSRLSTDPQYYVPPL